MPHIPGSRVVIAACLVLASASALGQSVVDSIRFPCPAPLPGGSHCLAYDYNDRLLYLGGDDCESLFVFDDRRGAMVGAVWFEDDVTAVCYNPLVNRIYCSTESDGIVYVIEPGSNRILQQLEVDDDIVAFALDSGGNRLFCVGGCGGVVVIDCATNVVEREVDLPTSFDIGVGVCYVPPLRRLYVAAESDSVIFVLDCAGESLLTAIQPGHQPSALCFNSANGELYSSSWYDSTVKAIDLAANSVIASMPCAQGSGVLCSNATGNKVYAVGGSRMSIFDGRTDSLKTSVDLGEGGCRSLVWDSRRNEVYAPGGSS